MTEFLREGDRVAVLAHDRFPHGAKTGVGLLRYADYDVVAVLDRERAGERVAEAAPDLPDAPIVESFEGVGDEVDALVIGIAPIGGDFEESWRPDVGAALSAGCDVVSGLHVALADDPEFAEIAETHDATIHDVRLPPGDLGVAEGTAGDVDAAVVLTVGTDGSVGKMTTSFELVAAAGERGIDAAVVPTGQTGIMIAGWGIAIDRVIADFAAGAVERMVHEVAPDNDLVVVEGQGAITHPAYSADAVATLHGSMADSLVLVHEAGHEAIEGWESFPIRDPGTHAEVYESVAAPVSEAPVAAGSLNTAGIASDDAAREAIADFGDAIGVPATDVIRFGADEILDAVLA